MTDTEQAVKKLKSLSRSERIKKVFGFEPFEYQAELLDRAENATVFKAALKPGRQVGKSVTGGHIAADRAIAGHDVMILAPFQDTTHDMMDAFREAMANAREKFARAGIGLGTEQENKTEWIFENGGRLRARTVGRDGTQIRGKNPNVLLVDEAAYIKDSIYNRVLKPYFSTHDAYEFYLFSTPAGKSGYFYEAVEHDDSFYSPHWPSSISPLVSDEFLAQERETMDSTSFAQEYLGEFVDEGSSFLPYALVNPCVGPTEPSGRVWLGVDIARKGKDRTVYTIMDESGEAEVLKAEDTSTIPGIVGQIKAFHREWGFERVLVDENAVGGGVVDDEELNRLGIMSGVTFTTKSKHQMYTRLKTDLESETITIPNERKLIDELTGLEFSVTANGYYKVHHKDGGHDDYADSLALANLARHGGGESLGTTQVTRRKARATMHKGR